MAACCPEKGVTGHGVNSNIFRKIRACDCKKCFKNKKKYDILGKDYIHKEVNTMQHIKTLNTKNLQNTVKKGGCGECQTSCQSACKTSCTVGNQSCENK